MIKLQTEGKIKSPIRFIRLREFVSLTVVLLAAHPAMAQAQRTLRSPEVQDGRVTFRIRAADANAVKVNLGRRANRIRKERRRSLGRHE